MDNKVGSNVGIIIKGQTDIPVGEMDDFKRPDHPDFMVSSELKKEGWSGIRHNSLADSMEIWVEGELRGSMDRRTVALYPEKWEALYAVVFGLTDVKIAK